MKKMLKIKKLILASFSSLTIFALCACSEEKAEQAQVVEAEKGINIKALIPEDAEIAAYMGQNNDLIKEARAIPEYKELIEELKKNNEELKELYLDGTAKLEGSVVRLLDLFIDPNDIVGSIESLAFEQEISLSFYLKGSMNIALGANPKGLLAVKTKSLSPKILEVLNAVSKESEAFTKTKIEGCEAFELDIDNRGKDTLFILSKENVFLLSLNKSTLKKALKDMENPSQSILNSAEFKNTISNPNSDIWIYLNKTIPTLISTVARHPAIVESMGLELDVKSLETAIVKLNVNLNDEFSLADIIASYKANNSSPAINIHEDAVAFLSLSVPYTESIGNLLKNFGASGVELMIIRDIQKLEISIPKQDLDVLDNGEVDLIANLYMKDATELLRAIETNIDATKLKSRTGVEYYQSEFVDFSFAKISNNRVSILPNHYIEDGIKVATSGKGNKKIDDALARVSVDNCVAQAYIDAKYINDFYSNIIVKAMMEYEDEIDPATLAMLAASNGIYTESTLVAKIGLTERSLNLVLREDTKINYKALKDFILLVVEAAKKEISNN